MLRSMTGFGKGEAENSYGRVYIEIKSLNHKYFDMASRLPTGFLAFEDKIKFILQKEMKRGKVNLSLDYEDFVKGGSDVYVDIKAAKKYAKWLKEIKSSLKLPGEITAQQIITMPGVLAHRPHKKNPQNLWPLIKKALTEATKQLLASKREEGRSLKKHLLQLSRQIERSLKIVIREAEDLKRKYKDKLTQNIKAITKGSKVYNKEKLEEEAAIFIRNSDITEELCRIQAHIKAFNRAVSKHKEVGRRLDFIAQELTREANTTGAKANNFTIAKEVIKIKSLVEKIREQTQNVE